LQAETTEQITSTLLFVDDEQNILSSLKRLFRSTGHKILTALSGAEALAILEKEEVDLIVSDMRMPEMDGAKLLSEVANKYPDMVRILLTGYADMDSTIRAVNEGHIYRYISKPWEDEDIKITVQKALETKHLQAERDRLLALTNKQNAELKDLNQNLETKVQQRTEELRLAHESLRKSYFSSIKTFSNLIELREGAVSGHSKRVAESAQKVATKLGLDKEQVQQIFFAALLHDIGKICLSDELIKKPFNSLAPIDKKAVAKHPVLGDALLMSFEPLHDAAKMIRSHHEYLDGSGYPDRLKGDAIPLGAKILAVVNDYDALQNGGLVPRRLQPDEARQYLISNRGRLYDTKVVDAFVGSDATGEAGPVSTPEAKVDEKDLKVGMVLARDLVTKGGILVLSEGYILDEKLIEKIHKFCSSTGEHLDIRIAMKRIK